MLSAEERARDGALWMDITSPGWAERIDQRELDISSCEKCILGQLHGMYGEYALGRIGLDWDSAADFGFDSPYPSSDYSNRAIDLALLAGAWLVEIRARLDGDEAIALGVRVPEMVP